MRWLLRVLFGIRPTRPAADRPESEIDRHTARIEALLHESEGEALPAPTWHPSMGDDPFFCWHCRRGCAGRWCGLCGREARSVELGLFNRDPFDRKGIV